MLDQAVEVIRKRVDVFGVSEPIISPVGSDRILVQIPGLDTAKIQEARDQLSRVAKLEFRMVYPDNGERLREDRLRESKSFRRSTGSKLINMQREGRKTGRGTVAGKKESRFGRRSCFERGRLLRARRLGGSFAVRQRRREAVRQHHGGKR